MVDFRKILDEGPPKLRMAAWANDLPLYEVVPFVVPYQLFVGTDYPLKGGGVHTVCVRVCFKGKHRSPDGEASALTNAITLAESRVAALLDRLEADNRAMMAERTFLSAEDVEALPKNAPKPGELVAFWFWRGGDAAKENPARPSLALRFHYAEKVINGVKARFDAYFRAVNETGYRNRRRYAGSWIPEQRLWFVDAWEIIPDLIRYLVGECGLVPKWIARPGFPPAPAMEGA